MIRLSIIIPCLEANRRFDDTLASVLQNRPEQCEVIVVHRGRYDDPYDLGGEVVFHEAPDDECLIGLLNLGLEAARGPIVHLLQCGCEVEEGWTDRAVTHFDDARVATVSPLVADDEAVRSPDGDATGYLGIAAGRISGRRVVVRSEASVGRVRPRPLGPSLTAGFYRAEALQDIGGFAGCAGPWYADVDAAMALAAGKLRCVVETSSRVFASAAPLGIDDAFQRGQAAERFFWRHVFSPVGGGLASILAHPLNLALDVVPHLPHGGALRQLLGRFSALTKARHDARFGRDLGISSPVQQSTKGKSRRIDQPHVERRAVGRSAETLIP